MDTQQFPQYLALFGSFALFFDIYYSISVYRFFKTLNLKSYIKALPLILFIIGIISITYSIYIRIMGIIPGEVAKYMFFYAIIWYVPKFLISPVIILKDLHIYLSTKIKKSKIKSGKLETFYIRQRKSFLRDTGWLLSVMPFIVIFHSLVSTTYNFEIKEVNIPIALNNKALAGFKIVHISDLHAGSFASADIFESVADYINILNPDLIVITGDIVNFHPVELSYITGGLKKLRAKYGIFGCLGNHDHYMNPEDHKALIDTLESCGVNLLINENVKVGIGSDTLQLAGMDNISYRHDFGDFDKALEGLSDNYPIILLLHDPYIWASVVAPKGKVDLTLGGHTHGGQMILNVDGITLSHMRLRYKHWRGLYVENGSILYLTRGIGTVGFPFRFGVRPEITVIKLK
jgi:uncharacterized protein